VTHSVVAVWWLFGPGGCSASAAGRPRGWEAQ